MPTFAPGAWSAGLQKIRPAAEALVAGEAQPAAKGDLAAKVVQKTKPEAAKGKLKPATERRA
jgi:hypothetical protein